MHFVFIPYTYATSVLAELKYTTKRITAIFTLYINIYALHDDPDLE